MTGRINKVVSAPEVDSRFSALIKDLGALKGYEAESMVRELERMRGKARSIITGKPTEVEKRKLDERSRRHNYVRELAYVGGDPANGLKKIIRLTENSLIEMEDLNMHYTYMGDVLLGIPAKGGKRVDLEFPDGITGTLYIEYSPEKDSINYMIRKNCTRSEEGIREVA